MSQHAIIHGNLDSFAEPAEDVFAETLVPQLPEVPFLDNLASLVTALRSSTELVETIDTIRPALPNELYIRVFTGMGETVLELWALLLTDVTTSAYRYEQGVDGEICGLLGGVRVKIVGLIPSDSVPEGVGDHEWTLPEEKA
jgi:hypothetical protein